MLKRIINLPGSLVGVEASGTVTTEDYNNVMNPLLKELHAQGKKVRFLYHFGPNFEDLTANAAWHDFKIGMQHFRLF